MRFLKQDLLTLLISLFLFTSCEKQAGIGLDIDPDKQIQGTLDTVSVTARTIQENPVATTSLIRYALGNLTDPILGKTTAALSIGVNLPNDAYSFGTNAQLDSAVLVLKHSSQFYGDSTANYTIDVRQLTNDITKEVSYLSNKSWSYNNNETLGSLTTQLKPNTKTKINDIVVGKPDTLKTVPAGLRIKLDKSIITSRILSLDSAKLKTSAAFNAAFKGLYVQVSQVSANNPGGIAFLDLSGSDSRLELYYRKQNATTATAIDTVTVNFPITNAYGSAASAIKHDYTNTDVLDHIANPAKYSNAYIQPLAGLKTKISFPSIKNFTQKVGSKRVVVNKAELVINADNASIDNVFSGAPRLSLYRYDIAESPVNVPDNDQLTQFGGDRRALNPLVFGGFFDSVNKRYVFVVTSYVQDLIDGKTQDYGTFLAATPSSEYLVTPSVTSAARSVIKTFNGTNSLLKLNVYYTKVN